MFLSAKSANWLINSSDGSPSLAPADCKHILHKVSDGFISSDAIQILECFARCRHICPTIIDFFAPLAPATMVSSPSRRRKVSKVFAQGRVAPQIFSPFDRSITSCRQCPAGLICCASIMEVRSMYWSRSKPSGIFTVEPPTRSQA